MKKFVSVILSLVMAISLVPVSVFAAEESYDDIKMRVSDIYGIPQDIVDHMDEEKVRNLDVGYSDVAGVSETYVHYVEDETGELVGIPHTEQEYLNYISTPQVCNNPDRDDSSGWMRVYAIIIDDGSNVMDISSTYTWLTQPRVIFNEYDLITLSWENGSYINGSASGFYSYNFNGVNYDEDITAADVVNPATNYKSVNYAHRMNDSGARRNEFFHLMVSIRKNTGAGMERATALYGHQQRGINWADALGGTANVISIAGSIVLDPSGALTFVAGLISIAGSVYDYYEEASVTVDMSY